MTSSPRPRRKQTTPDEPSIDPARTVTNRQGPTVAVMDPVTLLEMRVDGQPAPQGSKKAFQRGSKIVLVEMSARVKPWRELVHAQAHAVLGAHTPESGPIAVRIDFLMQAPKRRWRDLPLGRPDVDKLARAALDGLTGIAFADDSQVVDLHVTKRYAAAGESPGAHITVIRLPDAHQPAA